MKTMIKWPLKFENDFSIPIKKINIKQRGIAKMVKVNITRSKKNVKSSSSGHKITRGLSSLQGKRQNSFTSNRPNFSNKKQNKALRSVQRIGKTACKYLLKGSVKLTNSANNKLKNLERKF